MPTPQASEDFYRTLQRLQIVTVLAGRRAWKRMGADFDSSWRRVAPPLVEVTAAAQLAAASAAVAYVPAVLAETSQPDLPEARVHPRAFAGVASDGRSLEGLLTGSVAHAKQAARGQVLRDGNVTTYFPGMGSEAALAAGGKWLDTLLQSAVADAARDATAAEIVIRPNMGWVRMINPPCCSRCAVLAGKFYRWSDGFLRHPRCDCTHIPAAENIAGDFKTDATALAERGLITDLTKAQRQRIDDGADLNKVLNESRDRWRERMAADRAKEGPVDRLGRRRPNNWGGGDGKPLIPPGGTVQDLMANLTADVERRRAVSALQAAGIAE